MDSKQLIHLVCDFTAKGEYAEATKEVRRVANEVSKLYINTDRKRNQAGESAESLLNACRVLDALSKDTKLIQAHKDSIKHNNARQAKMKEREDCFDKLSKLVEEIIADYEHLLSLVDVRYLSMNIEENSAIMRLKKSIAENKFLSPEVVKNDIKILCDQPHFIKPYYSFARPDVAIKGGLVEEFELRKNEMSSREEVAIKMIDELVNLCAQTDKGNYISADEVLFMHEGGAKEQMDYVYRCIKEAEYFLD